MEGEAGEAGAAEGGVPPVSSSRVDDNSTAVMASLFRELEAAPLANGAVPPSVTALLQQTQRMKAALTAHPSVTSDSVPDVCALLRRCIPLVRRSCSRGVLGAKFWSRLDSVALQEQQVSVREMTEHLLSSAGSSAADDVAAPGMGIGGRQRSVSMEAAAHNIDPEEREQQQLLDTLRAPDDPYALVEAEIDGFEDGTREGVFAAVTAWMNSSDDAVASSGADDAAPGPPSLQRALSASGPIAQADKSAENRHRVLWIQGGPGTGKTTIQSALCARFANSVLGVHFCKHQTSRSSWVSMIKSLSFQLAERVPQYRALLLAQMEARAATAPGGAAGGIGAMSALELFQVLLTGILTQMPDRPQLLEQPEAEDDEAGAAGAAGPGDSVSSSPRPTASPSSPNSGKLLLLIDALDESDSATHPELLLLFKETWQWPSWIGLILSSRPVTGGAASSSASSSTASSSSSSSASSAALYSPSRDYVLVELSYESAETDHDMHLFVSRRLGQSMPHASESQRAQATRVIVERSSGMFLFSRLVLQEYEEQMSKYRYEVQCRQEAQRQALIKEKLKEGQSEGEVEGASSATTEDLPTLSPPALDAHSLEKLPLGLDHYFCQTMQRLADRLEAGAAAANESKEEEEEKKSSSSSSSSGDLVTLAEIMRLLRVVLAAQEPLSVNIVAKLLGLSSARIIQCLEPLRALFPLTAPTTASADVGASLITSTHKSVCDWLSSDERLTHENEKRFFVDIRLGHLLLASEGWKLLTHRAQALGAGMTAADQAKWTEKISAMRVDEFVHSSQPTPLLVEECAAASPDSLLAYSSRFQALHALHACHLPLLLACLTHLSFIEIRLRGQQPASSASSLASSEAAAASVDQSEDPAANKDVAQQYSRRGHQLLKEYHLALTTIKAEINARGGGGGGAAPGEGGGGDGGVAAHEDAVGDDDDEEALLVNAPAAAFEQSKFRMDGQSASSVHQSLLSALNLLSTFYRFVRAEISHFGPSPVLIYQDALSMPSVSPLFIQAAQLRSWWSRRCDWCEWLNKPDKDETDPCLLVLQGHTSTIDCCVFVRDMIVSGSDDASIRVWDSVSGEVRGVLTGHNAPVSALHYRPDVHMLYSASSDGLLRVWDMSSFQCVQELSLDGTCVSITFSPSSARVALCITNQRVQIMPVKADGLLDTSEIIAVINEGEWCCRALFHTEDVLVIATERSLELWQVSPQPAPDGTNVNDTPVRFLAGQHQMERLLHGDTFSSLECLRTRDEVFYITGAADSQSFLFNWKPSAEGTPHLNRLTCLQHDMGCGQSASIRKIAFAPYGRKDRPYHALNPQIAVQEEKKDGEGDDDGYYMNVRLAVSYVDNSVRVYQLSLIGNSLIFQTMALFLSHTYAAQCVAWSADGTLLVSSSQDSRLCVWDTRLHGVRRPREDLGESAIRYPGHQDAITALVVTPDGKQIISGGVDGTVRIWQPQDAVQPLVRVIQHGHVGPISCLAVTPYRRWDEGYVLASGSEDRMVRVFRLADGRLLDSVISHHSDQVQRLASSASGALLASASKDCTTRIWNTSTGRVEHSLCRGKVPMTAVAILPIPNSNNPRFPGLILTGNARGQLQIWTAGEWSQLEESLEDSVGSARLLLENTVHSESIVCIHVCHQFSVFCTVSSEGVVRVWQWDWESHLQPALHAQNNGIPQRKKGDLSSCLRGIQSLPRWPQLQANVACITADTEYLLFAGSQHPALCFYSLQARQLECVSILPGAASCMVASRTSDRVYVGDTRGMITLHNPQDPRPEVEGDDTPQIAPIWKKQVHERRVTAVDINRAETLLCTGSYDNSVHIYQIIDAAPDPAAVGPAAAAGFGRARGGLMIQSEVRVNFSPINSLCFNPAGSLIWLCGEAHGAQGSGDSNDLIWEIDVEASKVKRIWTGEFEAVKSMAWQNWQHRPIPKEYDDAKAALTSEDDERDQTGAISSLLFQSVVSVHRWPVFGVNHGSAPVERVGWSLYKLHGLAYPPNARLPLCASSNLGGEVQLWDLSADPVLSHVVVAEGAADPHDPHNEAGWNSATSAASPLVTRDGPFDAEAFGVKVMIAAGVEAERINKMKGRFRQRSVVGWSGDEQLIAVGSRDEEGHLIDLYTLDGGEPAKWHYTLERLANYKKLLQAKANAKDETEVPQDDPLLVPGPLEAPPTLTPCPRATRVAPTTSRAHTSLQFSTSSKWLAVGTEVDGVKLFRVKRDAVECKQAESKDANETSSSSAASSAASARLEDVLQIQPHMGAITAAHFSDAVDGPGQFPYMVCSGMDATVRLFDLRGVIKQANKRAEEAAAAATAALASAGDAMPNALPPPMNRAPSLARLPSIGGAAASSSVPPSSASSIYRFDFSSSRVQQVGLCHIVCHTRDEGLVVAPPVVVPTVLQLRTAPELVETALREMLSSTSQDWTQDCHLDTEASKYALRILRSGGMERCLLLVKAAIQVPSSPLLDHIIGLACSICGQVALVQRMAVRQVGDQRVQHDDVSSHSLITRTFSMLLPLLKRFDSEPLMLRPIYSACNCVTELWNGSKARDELVKPEVTSELMKVMMVQMKRYAATDGELPTPTLHDLGKDGSIPRLSPAQERTQLLRVLTNSVADLANRKRSLLTQWMGVGGHEMLLQIVQSDDVHISDSARSHALMKLSDCVQCWPDHEPLIKWTKANDMARLAYGCFERIAERLMPEQPPSSSQAGGLEGEAASSSSSSSAPAASAATPRPAKLARSGKSWQLVTFLTRSIGALHVFYTHTALPEVDRVQLMRRVLRLWSFMSQFAFSFQPWNTWWSSELIATVVKLVQQQDTATLTIVAAEEAAEKAALEAAAAAAAAAAARAEENGDEDDDNDDEEEAPAAPVIEGIGEGEGAVTAIADSALFECMISEGFIDLLLDTLERFGEVQDGLGTHWSVRDAHAIIATLANRHHVMLYDLLGGFDAWIKLLKLHMRTRAGDSQVADHDLRLMRLFGRLHDAYEIKQWDIEKRAKIDALCEEFKVAESQKRQQSQAPQPSPSPSHEEGAEGGEGEAASAADEAAVVAAPAPAPVLSRRRLLIQTRDSWLEQVKALDAAAASAAKEEEKGAVVEKEAASFTPVFKVAQSNWELLSHACLHQSDQLPLWLLRSGTFRSGVDHPFSSGLLRHSGALEFFTELIAPPTNYLNASHMPRIDAAAENLVRILEAVDRKEKAAAASSSASSSSSAIVSAAATAADEVTYSWLVEKLRGSSCTYFRSPQAGGDVLASGISEVGASVLVVSLLRVLTHPSVSVDSWLFDLFLLLPLLLQPQDLLALTWTDERARIHLKIRRVILELRKDEAVHAPGRKNSVAGGAQRLQQMMGFPYTSVFTKGKQAELAAIGAAALAPAAASASSKEEEAAAEEKKKPEEQA